MHIYIFHSYQWIHGYHRRIHNMRNHRKCHNTYVIRVSIYYFTKWWNDVWMQVMADTFSIFQCVCYSIFNILFLNFFSIFVLFGLSYSKHTVQQLIRSDRISYICIKRAHTHTHILHSHNVQLAAIRIQFKYGLFPFVCVFLLDSLSGWYVVKKHISFVWLFVWYWLLWAGV